jgi:hypothetical protein
MQNKHGQVIEKATIDGIPIQLVEQPANLVVEEVVLQSEEEAKDEAFLDSENAQVVHGMTYTEVEQ